MPPRKSNVSTTSNGAEEGAGPAPTKSKKSKEIDSIDQLTLPKSMIARLAKGVLPANTNIGKDAMTAMHRSATVFVSYIAANASENASAAGKKTMMPADVMAALKDAEFEKFIPKLEAELKKHSEVECNKRNDYRRRVREEKEAGTGTQNGDGGKESDATPAKAGAANGDIEADDDERPAKKRKSEGGALATNGTGDEEAGSDQDGDDPQDDEDENDSEVEGEEEEDEEEDEEEEDEVGAEDTALTNDLDNDRMDDSNPHGLNEQSDSD